MLIYIGDVSQKYYYGVYNIIKMLYPKSEITRENKDCDLKFEIETSDDFVMYQRFCKTFYREDKS